MARDDDNRRSTTMAFLSVPTFDIERFTLHKDELVTEASDLGYRAGVEPVGRLYDDACDEGIAVRTNSTGKVEHFYLDKRVSDADGDLTAWEFKPVRDIPGLTKVVIFND